MPCYSTGAMLADTPHFVALDWNGTLAPYFEAPLFPGAKEALAAFRAAGLPLIVVSHATQAQIEAAVAHSGERFDAVYGCEDKAEILSAMRLQYGQGVFLGDHPSDARAAAASGLPFLQAALQGQLAMAGAAARFQSWAEVLPLILVASGDAG